MAFMDVLTNIVRYFPEVEKPTSRLTLKKRLYYTLLILAIYFTLGSIPLAGLSSSILSNLEFLSMVMGAKIGTLLTLGIGPIVTASIILQLLMGAGLLKFDVTNPNGRKKYQATQKLFSVIFIIIEAYIYVFLGGLRAQGDLLSLKFLLFFQLLLGGFMILLLDELSTKWGIGSGISLFILAGVAQSLFVRLFSPFAADGSLFFVSKLPPVGAIPALIAFFSPTYQSPEFQKEIFKILLSLLGTVVVFFLSIYFQSMKVEINLSPKNARGIRYPWPLQFLYTSNIPVILTSALLANLQYIAKLTSGQGKFYDFVSKWLINPNFVRELISNGFSWVLLARALVYLIVIVGLSTLFSYLWVQTSGMDAKSQAKNIVNMGFTIPGYRTNEKLLERLLNRYIPYLAILGGITIGLLAAIADLLGALVRGTGLLLSVMIVYNFYQNILRQYAQEMSPELRKFMKG